MSQRKTELKVRFVPELPMSKQGYKCWSPHLRSRIWKKVYGKPICMVVPVERFKNKEEIGKLASENVWDGRWILMGYSKGKTKTGVKLVGLCRIILRTKDGRYNAKVMHLKFARLSRYWFWEG